MGAMSIIEYFVPKANNTICIVAARELDPSPNLANANVKHICLLINLIMDEMNNVRWNIALFMYNLALFVA